MIIALISCLLYPIMVIQSYIIYKDKIHEKSMNKVLKSKC